MKNSISIKAPSGSLRAALAIAALAVFSVSAHAADYDQVTVHGSTTKTVGFDDATAAPIQKTTVKVRVTYDPVTLTTNSGIALLNDSVADAARKACFTADPLLDDDGTCVRNAIESAQPQIARAITLARSSSND
jgi:UrcA family protein